MWEDEVVKVKGSGCQWNSQKWHLCHYRCSCRNAVGFSVFVGRISAVRPRQRTGFCFLYWTFSSTDYIEFCVQMDRSLLHSRHEILGVRCVWRLCSAGLASYMWSEPLLWTSPRSSGCEWEFFTTYKSLRWLLKYLLRWAFDTIGFSEKSPAF